MSKHPIDIYVGKLLQSQGLEKHKAYIGVIAEYEERVCTFSDNKTIYSFLLSDGTKIMIPAVYCKLVESPGTVSYYIINDINITPISKDSNSLKTFYLQNIFKLYN
jgi:hypothetical protein